MAEIERPVEASLFEGLFKRALHPTGEFAAALQRVGFDPADMKPRYPAKVWADAVEVARVHTFPNLPPAAGMRELGRRFSQGFFDTIIGKVIAVSFPLVGPDMMIKLSPRNVRAGRPDVLVTPVKEADRRWRVTFVDPLPHGEFVAGVVETAGSLAGAQMNIAVEARPAGYELLITW